MKCSVCSSEMIVRDGKHGKFLACPKSYKDNPHPTQSIVRTKNYYNYYGTAISQSSKEEAEQSHSEERWYSEEDSSWFGTTEYQGGKVSTQWHDDGRTTYHWGGPCAPTTYDEYGEEC